MIDKGLTYAYAEGGPVASEGRPRPNPFVRPMPNGKPVYNNITVGGPAVLPPAAAPVGDLFPQQPVFDRQPIIDYFDENGKRVFIGIDGRFPDQPVVPPPVQPVVPPPVTGPDGTSRTYSPFDGFAGGSMAPTYTAPTYIPPFFSGIRSGPVTPLPPTYTPPVFGDRVNNFAADTRAAGYDAAIQRFANSPFVRPEGIMGLQRGKLRLS
jgi:hypothetical protein